MSKIGIIVVVIIIVVAAFAGGFGYYFGHVNSGQNNNPSQNKPQQNNTEPQTDPLLKVASHTVIKSYYAVTNTEKKRTDIILIAQAPGLYEAWIEQKARFFLYPPDHKGMAVGFYYGLEQIETVGNNEYKITIPTPMYVNLNGDRFDMTLGYGWTGYMDYYRDYKDTYPISSLHFYVHLSVGKYLIGQWDHGNNKYSISDFEYIYITNDGNCPFYFYMNPKTLHGIDLVVQDKTFDMQWCEGPTFTLSEHITFKFKFIVDITGSVSLQGGDWPAKIVFKDYLDQSQSVTASFTIHIGP